MCAMLNILENDDNNKKDKQRVRFTPTTKPGKVRHCKRRHLSWVNMHAEARHHLYKLRTGHFKDNNIYIYSKKTTRSTVHITHTHTHRYKEFTLGAFKTFFFLSLNVTSHCRRLRSLRQVAAAATVLLRVPSSLQVQPSEPHAGALHGRSLPRC